MSHYGVGNTAEENSGIFSRIWTH